ncbi:hypothetical protein SteCoe_21180 [Stentor coeruleus]|uniref:Ion transport domain-containing protein n=1 Tax=Stentor coeruleus TaxID=5963 RepID=A0A1R2BQC6_9CILI|nr:hypothetical protein SteCoe_21180 [Stentor coeruleus]
MATIVENQQPLLGNAAGGGLTQEMAVEQDRSFRQLVRDLNQWDHNAAEVFYEDYPIESFEVLDETYILFFSASTVRIMEIYPNSLLPKKSISILTQDSIKCIARDSENKILFIGHANSLISKWDLESIIAAETAAEYTQSNQDLNYHEGCISFLEMTPSNQYLISASEDKTIVVWIRKDNDDFEPAHQFTEINSNVTCLAICDELLITGFNEGFLAFWDVENRILKKSFQENKHRIICLKVSSDKSLVATGSEKPEIHLWSVQSLALEGVLSGHVSRVRCLAFAHESEILISAEEEDARIIIWDTQKLNMLFKLTGHRGLICSMFISEDDHYLFTGSSDKEIKIWNIVGRKEEAMLTSHRDKVKKISSFRDKIISCSDDKSLRIWKLCETNLENMRKLNDTVISWASCIQNSTQMLLISEDGDLNLSMFNGETMEKVFSFYSNMDSKASCVKFTNDGSLLFIGLSNSIEYITNDLLMQGTNWDEVEDARDILLKRINFEPFDNECTIMEIYNNQIFIGFKDGSLKVADITTKNGIIETKLCDKKIIGFHFYPQESKVVIISQESRIRILSIPDCIETEVINIRSDIYSSAFLEVGKLIIGCSDGSIMIWSKSLTATATTTTTTLNKNPSFFERQAKIIQAHTKDVTHLIIKQKNPIQALSSKQEYYIISGSLDNSIKVWECSSWAEYCTFYGHTETITDLALCPGNDTDNYIMSCSEDKTVQIWNLIEKRNEVVFEGHKRDVNFVIPIQTTTGLKIISASADQTLRFWSNKIKGSLTLTGVCSNIDEYCARYSFKNASFISKSQINITISENKFNYAHFFCFKGFSKQLEAALMQGCDIRTDDRGHSPCFYAIQRKSMKCAEVLLDFLIELAKKGDSLSLSKFIEYCHAMRDDFNELLGFSPRNLPQFLAAIFVKHENCSTFAVPLDTLPILKLGISSAINQSEFVTFEQIEAPGIGVMGQQEELSVEFKSCAIELPLKAGSNDSIEMLECMLNCRNTKILRTPLITTILKEKWDRIWIFLFILAILFWINLGLMIALIMDFTNNWLKLSFIGINCLLILYELVQLMTSGFSYFFEWWNVLDVIRFFISFTWIMLSYIPGNEDHESLSYLGWFTVTSNFTRGISCFRVFSHTRFYVKLIIRSLKEVLSFLVIFFYSTLAFGAIFRESGLVDDKTEFDYFWKMPYDLNLGGLESDTSNGFRYACFMIASIVNVTIMLNLLISILGDAFEQFQIDSVVADHEEMLEGIIEVEKLMFWNRDIKEKWHIQICDEAQDEEDEDEWQGIVRAYETRVNKLTEIIKAEFKDSIEKVENRFTESQASAVSKIESLNKKIDNNQATLVQAIEGIKSVIK